MKKEQALNQELLENISGGVGDKQQVIKIAKGVGIGAAAFVGTCVLGVVAILAKVIISKPLGCSAESIRWRRALDFFSLHLVTLLFNNNPWEKKINGKTFWQGGF